MPRFTIFVSILALTGVAPSAVFGLGADHPKGPLAASSHWPEGLLELANRDNRVHGFFVNSEDIFFYTGDAQAFNQFMEAYSKLKKTSLKVVMHPGGKKARSPWDKAERHIPTEWSLYCDGGERTKDGKIPTHVDLWLGGRVKLDDVRIPANVEVVSGGEIEKFIAERAQKGK